MQCPGRNFRYAEATQICNVTYLSELQSIIPLLSNLFHIDILLFQNSVYATIKHPIKFGLYVTYTIQLMLTFINCINPADHASQ
jgi:hypothetical protein